MEANFQELAWPSTTSGLPARRPLNSYSMAAAAKWTCLLLVVLLCVSYAFAAPSEGSPTADQQDEDDQQLAKLAAEPTRQYFKLNANQTGRAPSKTKARRRPASVVHIRGPSAGDGHDQQLSSAKLRRLLSQAKEAHNSTNQWTQPNKGTNFKFISIQRSKALAKTAANKTESSEDLSLAASVARQLAKELSAADKLKGESSISSLARIAQTVAPVAMTTTTTTAQPSETTTSGLATTQRSQATKTKAKKTKPSKVYNLPVKFVSNGQPSHVVFSSLRRHLAAIRRLQQERQSSEKTTGGVTGATTRPLNRDPSTKNNQKRPTVGHKFKPNSKLIYLPLIYLSNAKPSKITYSKSVNSKSNQSTLS